VSSFAHESGSAVLDITRPTNPQQNPYQSVSSQERKRRTAELLAAAHGAEGDHRQEILDEVILLNIPVAHSLAARYRNRGQPTEELQQVACLALTRTVQAFTPERGDDLLVYAVPSILGELKRHFRDTSWAVRPPRRLQELRPRISAAEEELSQELGRPPNLAEVAERVGCSEEDAEEALACAACSHAEPLDEEPYGDQGGTARVDHFPSVESGYDWTEAVAVLAPACRQLKGRDRLILRLRFYEQLSQRQIAEELGVTQVQVSRLLQRILGDLRTAITEPPSVTAA